MTRRWPTLALGISLSLAATAHAQKGKGGGNNKPSADTPVIVVLPSAGETGCGTLGDEDCGLTNNGNGVYATDDAQGVNAILFESDGNLSLQFSGVGKGKNVSFPRAIVPDTSRPIGALTGSLPDLATLEPDYLFAAPDRGDGLNCLLPDRPCCVDPSTCFGTFGTVTGTWEQVRLAYRFTASTATGEERYWSLEWHDIDDSRFARMECLESDADGCVVWRVTADVATLSSRGQGNDVQPTGDFEMASQIVVCRDGASLSQGSCDAYLTTSP